MFLCSLCNYWFVAFLLFLLTETFLPRMLHKDSYWSNKRFLTSYSFIHSLDRVDSRGPSRRLPVTTIGSPVPFRSDAKCRAVCNVVEPRLTWTTAWSTPAWVRTDVPSHTDGLPQGSMCRDVTLQPYNMAKQLQPPPVNYLLHMRESRGIQNFVIADEMEPLESNMHDHCGLLGLL